MPESSPQRTKDMRSSKPSLGQRGLITGLEGYEHQTRPETIFFVANKVAKVGSVEIRIVYLTICTIPIEGEVWERPIKLHSRWIILSMQAKGVCEQFAFGLIGG